MHTIQDFTVNSLYLLLAIIISLVHIAACLLNDIVYLVIRQIPCCLCLPSHIILDLSILCTSCLELWSRLRNDLVVVLNETIVSFRLLLLPIIAQRRKFLRYSRVDSLYLIILGGHCESSN